MTRIAVCSAAVLLAALLTVLSVSFPSEAAPSPSVISIQDRAFLEDMEHRGVLYFWEQTDPATGLVLDRADVAGGRAKGPSRNIASLAATGFGLTAICIGASAVGFRVTKQLSAFEPRCSSSPREPFMNMAGFITGWTCRMATASGIAKFLP